MAYSGFGFVDNAAIIFEKDTGIVWAVFIAYRTVRHYQIPKLSGIMEDISGC